jgi:hypothetical protein
MYEEEMSEYDDISTVDFFNVYELGHELTKTKVILDFVKRTKNANRDDENRFKLNLEAKINSVRLKNLKFLKRQYELYVENFLSDLLQQHIFHYKLQIRSYTKFSDENQFNQYLKLHERFKNETVNQFLKSKKVGIEEDLEKYKLILENQIDTLYHEVIEISNIHIGIWMKFNASDTLKSIPENAVEVPYPSNKAIVVRAFIHNTFVPGQYIPGHGYANIFFNGKVFHETEFEVSIKNFDQISIFF